MSKQFVAILIVVIIVLVGVFIATKDEASSPTNGDINNGQPSNHTQGAGNEGVTLTEYGDFQCPACRSYYPIVQQIKNEYGDDITFRFRHFPLTQIHNHAYQASRAAEAAGLQGKFFPMHDLLYENQQTWSQSQNPTDTFVQYARQLELDVEKFRSDMSSAQVASTINADIDEAKALGATSTPTFTINGEKIETNPQDVEGFKALIDEAMQNSGSEQ